MPTRDARGIASLRSPICFPTTSVEMVVRPVMFPPGRARLAMSPLATGSNTFTITIGIVLVASLAARAA